MPDQSIPAEQTAIPLTAGDIESVVTEIQQTSIVNLRNHEFLREILLPRLGFNNEILHEFPKELLPWCGFGVKSWQYPIQFSKYLVSLSYRKIETYAEIGVRHGGTFIITLEYLKRFSRIRAALALDIEYSPILGAYAERNPEIQYLINSSAAEESRKTLSRTNWDHILIDGDHSFQGCWSDFQTVRNNARAIAFHDIVSAACPGVIEVWQRIKAIMPDRSVEEFTDQYSEVQNRTGKNFLGIGVVAMG